MNRRKNLWIALAALAVVVVMCALALIYRPVPFEFLRGASASPPELMTIIGYGPVRSFTITEYMVEGSFEEVTAWARKELTTEDGWVWQGRPDEILNHANRAADQCQVMFYVWAQDFLDEPRRDRQRHVVRVVVYMPATWIDRIIVRELSVPD